MVKVRRSFACCTVWKVRERVCLPRTTRKRKEGEKKEKLCLFDWVIQAIVGKSNCENTDYRGNGLLRWWPKSSWRCLPCGWLSTPTAGGTTKQTAKIRLARSNMKSTVERKSKAQSWRQTATVVTQPSGLQRVSFPLFFFFGHSGCCYAILRAQGCRHCVHERKRVESEERLRNKLLSSYSIARDLLVPAMKLKKDTKYTPSSRGGNAWTAI